MARVSVVLPVFNGAELLPLAIESVLKQSFRDFELIILDDGSSEDIASIVANYDDPRVRFVSRANKGLGATLNELIELARCDYIARMDADDVCEPRRLELQIRFMESNPEVVLVGGQIQFIVGDRYCAAGRMPMGHEEIINELMRSRFPLCHPAILFRKSAAGSVGGYRVNGAGEDLDFFLRMGEVGLLANISEPVLNYRIQTQSLSMRHARDLNKGYTFAVENAFRRRNELPEHSFEEFSKSIWPRRSFIKKLRDTSQNISERLYRRGLLAKGRSSLSGYIFFIMLTAIMRPRAALRRVRESKLLAFWG
ncbi:glycosyltransferase [Cupriavidus necator]|uniref:glycosyltransferase n=1 Tax=Cupriavidus necator TaxID=106590 RepID=UPI003ECC965F